MDVLCIGLMVCDILIKPVDKTVFDVDSTRLETLKIAAGGDSLNAAINMSKLGLNVGLIGKVGNDIFSEYIINEAARFGVNTDGIIRTDNCTTSISIALLDKSGERHFAYYGEANDSLCIEDIDIELLRESKIVHVGSAMALNKLDGPDIEELFKKAKMSGATTSMDVTWDSTGRWLEKIEKALHYTDVFLPSYNEAKMISNKESTEEMEQFFKKYGLKIFAVKLGSEGCFVTDFNKRCYIKTFNNVRVFDTTGAGDAFVSGFLTGLTKGYDIYGCGLLGNAVASNCVMEIGATAGVKSLEETMKFIDENN